MLVTPTSPAMSRAFRQISAIPHQCFKDRVRFALRNPESLSVKSRYGARMAFLHRLPVNTAITRIEQWHALEMRSYQIACALGRGNRLALLVLSELRLIFRFLRMKGVAKLEQAA